ncbi:hypothetical protein R3P38DRAFT_2771082 [Favolaschia claudopus]|uniref:Uncharacterized protein n=1 Tax=Favolaschia claudopus TaxID=2862362 RepID=A0AAW0CCA1_9AGAR
MRENKSSEQARLQPAIATGTLEVEDNPDILTGGGSYRGCFDLTRMAKIQTYRKGMIFFSKGPVRDLLEEGSNYINTRSAFSRFTEPTVTYEVVLAGPDSLDRWSI